MRVRRPAVTEYPRAWYVYRTMKTECECGVACDEGETKCDFCRHPQSIEDTEKDEAEGFYPLQAFEN